MPWKALLRVDGKISYRPVENIYKLHVQQRTSVPKLNNKKTTNPVLNGQKRHLTKENTEHHEMLGRCNAAEAAPHQLVQWPGYQAVGSGVVLRGRSRGAPWPGGKARWSGH